MIEITVMDEDKDHKYEFLGKVLVPLLYCTVLYCTVLYCTGAGPPAPGQERGAPLVQAQGQNPETESQGRGR